MHPNWPRSLRDQCVDAGVPFLFKQWGEYVSAAVVADDRMAGGFAYNDPRHGGRTALQIRGARRPSRTAVPGDRWEDGRVMLDEQTIAIRIGKGKAGRELDGRLWDEYPS